MPSHTRNLALTEWLVLKAKRSNFSVNPTPGYSDSGNLEQDMTDLFKEVGKAAQAANKGWVLFIDEVQYLREPELVALIVAIHEANQQALPIMVCGAGLPQLTKLSGDAKSYSERLFLWNEIGKLEPVDAAQAIREPVIASGAQITEDAVAEILVQTEGYPYFLQEWGHHSWNVANDAVIDVEDVKKATALALHSLDNSFFRVRYDRLTDAERRYTHAMAQVGHEPCKSGDVAKQMGRAPATLTRTRNSVIQKGMVYSPRLGELAFTAPKFGGFMERNAPN